MEDVGGAPPLLRIPVGTGRLQLGQPAVIEGIDRQAGGVAVVGMPIIRWAYQADVRPVFADHLDDPFPEGRFVLQFGVGQPQVFTDIQSDNLSGFARFLQPLFGGAAASHLSLGEVDYPDFIAQPGQFGQRTAAAQLGVVGMCRQCQNINFFHNSIFLRLFEYKLNSWKAQPA